MKTFAGCALIVLAAVLAISGCSRAQAPGPGPVVTKPTEAKPVTPEIVKGNTVFALDLYAKLREGEGNLFLSPMSISTALGMTYAGARGKTAEEMSAVLHLPADQEKAHEALGSLTGELNTLAEAEGVRVSIANALWGQKGYAFRDEFLATVKKHYGGGLGEVDFARPEAARATINAWVEKYTQDKIKDLIPEGVLDAMTRLVLTNAIYFKGDWESPFEKHATHDAPFHLSADKQVQAPLMFQEERFPYAKAEGLQVLEMPYKGGRMSMVIVLPDKVDGLSAVEKEFTPANLEKWLGALKPTELYVYVPKFETTAQFELNKTLAGMGMSLAFDVEKADLSGMTTTEKLFISNVIHKAWVRVDEKGTEAAAATAVVAKGTAGPLEPPPTFRADHPFFFLIRDTKTGSILFMGRVVNPKG
jgi:serpin B